MSERPELVEKYDVENYDLIQGQTFDGKLAALIPRGTPEYLDHGEKYVERITRALYHFKQCALIGPRVRERPTSSILLQNLLDCPSGKSTVVYRLPLTIFLEGTWVSERRTGSTGR